MRHAFIDAYTNLNSPIHSMPVKLKIIFIFVFLLTIVLSPPILWLILLYAGVVFSLIYISKIPLRFIFTRMIEALLFILFISILNLFRKNGGIFFAVYLSKALLAIALTIIISSTTKFNELLGGLKGLGLPKPIILLISFMYRYVFLLEDQFLRTKRAYESRAAIKRNGFAQFKVLSNIVGILFIRTYERAERVYLAMCARGFDGEKGN